MKAMGERPIYVYRETETKLRCMGHKGKGACGTKKQVFVVHRKRCLWHKGNIFI